jgi:hypothetical protein
MLNTNLDLELVEITRPYLESYILANLISLNDRATMYRYIKKTVLNLSSISTTEKTKTVHTSSPLLSIGADLKQKRTALFTELTQNPSSSSAKGEGRDTTTLLRSGHSISENLEQGAIVNKEIASKLTGVKMRISGRLSTQRVVPKRTMKTAYKGSVSKSRFNLVETSTFTGKNRRGAFSVRISLSHGVN